MFLLLLCCNKASNRIVLTSKGFSVFFWITLSHEVSRHFPIHTHTHQYMRTLRTFYIFAVHRPAGGCTPSTTSLFGLNITQWRVKDFPDGGKGANRWIGAKSYYLARFWSKTIKIKKLDWGTSFNPPMIHLESIEHVFF